MLFLERRLNIITRLAWNVFLCRIDWISVKKWSQRTKWNILLFQNEEEFHGRSCNEYGNLSTNRDRAQYPLPKSSCKAALVPARQLLVRYKAPEAWETEKKPVVYHPEGTLSVSSQTQSSLSSLKMINEIGCTYWSWHCENRTIKLLNQ